MYFDNIVDTREESTSVVYPFKNGLLGKNAGIGIGIKAYQGGDIEVNMLNSDGSLKSTENLQAE